MQGPLAGGHGTLFQSEGGGGARDEQEYKKLIHSLCYILPLCLPSSPRLNLWSRASPNHAQHTINRRRERVSR